MALNDRHKRFAKEYIIDLNGAQAYLRAGYKVSADVAGKNAHRLLKNAEILAYIQKLQNDRATRTDISADRVLKELGRIAFSDVAKTLEKTPEGLQLKDLNTLDEEVTAAIGEISESRSEKTSERGEESRTEKTARFSIKMHNKLGALTALMQHLGMTSDFNVCLAGLRKYGLELWQDENGKWQVTDANAQADGDELSED